MAPNSDLTNANIETKQNKTKRGNPKFDQIVHCFQAKQNNTEKKICSKI